MTGMFWWGLGYLLGLFIGLGLGPIYARRGKRACPLCGERTLLHVPPPSEGYRINPTDPASITCHRCGRTSSHYKDVAYKFCAHCHIFHSSGRIETRKD